MARRYEQQSKKDGDQGSTGTIITPDMQTGASRNATSSSHQANEDRSSSAGSDRSRSEARAGEGDRTQGRPGAPVGWPLSPFGMMNRMFEEMDRFFEDFGVGRNRLFPRMRDVVGEGQRSLGALWTPQIEVTERDGQLLICADLPGLRKEDVKVELTEDALTIRGERREEQNRAGYSERFYGNFYRRVPLPEGANANEAQARFQDGVLEISVPMQRQEPDRRRQLDIR